MADAAPEAHVIVSTHTARWLRRTLLGVASQRRPADSVTVTCDNDRADIREVVARTADERGLPITLVQRPHHGVARPSQVRNNGVRALLRRGVSPGAKLIMLDGDCVPQADHIALHLGLGESRDIVVAFVVYLTPEQTEGFDEEALRQGRPAVSLSAEQVKSLHRRHRRYRRQQMLRRIGLAKSHKPKVVSGHLSVSLAIYRQVNGYDEEFEGWGAEDDDFGRRVHAAGGRSVVAVRDVVVLHQDHPTSRRPASWSRHDNAVLFRQKRPWRCLHGLEEPVPQHEVEVMTYGT